MSALFTDLKDKRLTGYRSILTPCTRVEVERYSIDQRGRDHLIVEVGEGQFEVWIHRSLYREVEP